MSPRRLMFAVPAAAFAALLLAGPANASTVQIQDDANVLNATTVQNEAATLPVPILIWTSTQDAANKSAFDRDAEQKVTAEFPVVLAINTQAKHETMQIGSAAGLSQSQAIAAEQSANSVFDNTMKSSGDYTGAVGAALTSLKGSLQARGNSNSNGNGAAATNTKSSPVKTIVTFALIVVVLIVIVAAMRRLFRPARRMRDRVMGGMPMGGMGGVNQGYGPPPGYGPQGYGPGYNQGMSPGAAGAIGAVGGGLLGYELGKMEGENQQFRRDEMMGGGFNNGGFDNGGGWDNNNNGGGFGGDQGNNWVVGQDSDFSGGDSGGGGDFGGGGDNSGGGGGDW